MRYLFHRARSVTTIILATLLFSLSYSSIAEQPVIKPQDLNSLLGHWEGSLTYVDYRSNQSYSMPARLTIASIEASLDLKLDFVYPNETSANSEDRLVVSADRSHLNGQPITSRCSDTSGTVEISTEHRGQDGNENRDAMLRNTYKVSSQKLLIQKHVRFEGTDDWFKRSEFKLEKSTTR